MINLTFLKAFTEASRYWHLACNYDRANPGDSSVKLSENNPHANNYRKALAKLEGTVATENPCSSVDLPSYKGSADDV